MSDEQRLTYLLTKYSLATTRQLIEQLPKGRERALALTRFDEAEMWLDKSVAE